MTVRELVDELLAGASCEDALSVAITEVWGAMRAPWMPPHPNAPRPGPLGPVKVQNVNRNVRAVREPSTGRIAAGGAYEAPIDWNRRK